MTTDLNNFAATLRDVIERNGDFSFVTDPIDGTNVTQAALISLPTHRKIEDITHQIHKYAQTMRPFRRKGTAKLATLQSLIDWTNRFKSDASVLFANPDATAPTLTCIANYHASGPANGSFTGTDEGAAHADHRGVYAFPVSKEWKRWIEASGKAMDKDEMGQFIDNNAKDFIDPTPALLNPALQEAGQPWEQRLIDVAQKIGGRFGHHLKLVEMARVFQVYETSNLAVTSNRDTGESTIAFTNDHKDADGRPLQIPNLFLIAIPVFESGALYRLPVRFQYRKSGSAVKFTLTVYDPARAMDDAFDEAVAQATASTNLPVFEGAPES
jgi:hypothetical protein